jgi:hypothetical protein
MKESPAGEFVRIEDVQAAQQRESAKDAERLREVLRELLELRGIGEGPPQQLLTAEQWWGRWRAAWKAAALAARGEKP